MENTQEKIGNVNRDWNSMNQKEIKNTVMEMNYFDGFTSRLDIVEQRNGELECMSIETSQTGFTTYFQTPKWLLSIHISISRVCTCNSLYFHSNWVSILKKIKLLTTNAFYSWQLGAYSKHDKDYVVSSRSMINIK